MQLADLRAHAGLRQLHRGDQRAARPIGGLHRIGDLQIEEAIDGEGGIVERDADLRRHLRRHLAQVEAVGNAIHEGHEDVQPRRQGAVEAAEAFDDP